MGNCYWDWLTRDTTADGIPPNYFVYQAVEPLVEVKK